jgi:inhibitor of KinA sporulation pathway (predicted exonuclease)
MSRSNKDLEELKLQQQAILMMLEHMFADINAAYYDSPMLVFRERYQNFYEDAKRELEAAKKHAGT